MGFQHVVRRRGAMLARRRVMSAIAEGVGRQGLLQVPAEPGGNGFPDYLLGKPEAFL
jgi:hypothetical protein